MAITILIKHRIPNSKDFLSLDDEGEHGFCIRYNEFTTFDGEECYMSANPQFHKDYNEALKLFNLRRESSNPFNPV